MTRLTVAIPTYDRPEALRRTLEALAPQIDDECELLLLDNCSKVPAADVARGVHGFPWERARIVRHSCNIGMSANITRCLEEAAGEWVWTLGDDDTPRRNAVETIKKAASLHPDAAYMSFGIANGLERQQEFETIGLAETISKSEAFCLVMLSAGVYRLEKMRSLVRFGYQYGYSLMPQVAMLVAGLGEGEKCAFLRETIADAPKAKSSGGGWSAVDYQLGGMSLLELEMAKKTRKELRRKIRKSGRSVKSIGLILLQRAAKGGANLDTAKFLWKESARRVFEGSDERLLAGMFSVMMAVPKFGAWAARLAYRTKNGRMPRSSEERFERS